MEKSTADVPASERGYGENPVPKSPREEHSVAVI